MNKLIFGVLVFIMFCIIATFVWAEEEVSSCESITETLRVPPCPYENPKNIEEANANFAYIAQCLKAIQIENEAAIERLKKYVSYEKEKLTK